jgi:hypothetical protein
MTRYTRAVPPAGEPPSGIDSKMPATPAQPGKHRYVVEPCSGGGARPVCAVVDTARKPLSRVVCRTSPADAKMVVSALNSAADDWRREYFELAKALWRGYAVYVSAGCGHGAFDRHVWPVIRAARRRIRRAIVKLPRPEPLGKADLLVLAIALKKVNEGSGELDQEIADAVGAEILPYTTSLDAALSLVDLDQYDYVVGSVNGQVGGTPYAQVGQHTCYSGTVPLALCAAALTARGSDPDLVYAVGYSDAAAGDGYGMVLGPTPCLDACLDYVPDLKRDCCILEFKNGARGEIKENRIVARWDESISNWVRTEDW